MRYITIPVDQTIMSNGEPARVSFASLCLDNVWGDPRWRESGDSARLFSSLHRKLATCKAGDVVELTDQEFEAFEPIITGRGKNLPGHVAAPMMALISAVFEASTEDPRGNGKVEATA